MHDENGMHRKARRILKIRFLNSLKSTINDSFYFTVEIKCTLSYYIQRSSKAMKYIYFSRQTFPYIQNFI